MMIWQESNAQKDKRFLTAVKSTTEVRKIWINCYFSCQFCLARMISETERKCTLDFSFWAASRCHWWDFNYKAHMRRPPGNRKVKCFLRPLRCILQLSKIFKHCHLKLTKSLFSLGKAVSIFQLVNIYVVSPFGNLCRTQSYLLFVH